MAIKSLHSEHLEGRWRKYKYRFFISYSHKDTARIDEFDQRLRRYRLPKELESIWTQFGPPPKTLKPYFRDRRTMGAGHSLDGDVLEALRTSAALIVFCSPNSAKSGYVNKEIRLFRDLHAKEAARYGEQPRIFPIIIDGDPASQGDDQCFPPALGEQVLPDGTIDTENLIEPIAADAREEGDGPDSAFYKLLAGLLGVDADLISREDIRRERRENTRFAFLATIVSLVIVGLTGVLLNNAMQDRKRWTAQDNMLAERAQQMIVEGNFRRAKLAALEGTNQARLIVLNEKDRGWLSWAGVIRPQSQVVLETLKVAIEAPYYMNRSLVVQEPVTVPPSDGLGESQDEPDFAFVIVPGQNQNVLGFYDNQSPVDDRFYFYPIEIDGYNPVNVDDLHRVVAVSDDRGHTQVFQVSNSFASGEVSVTRNGIQIRTDWIEPNTNVLAKFAPDPRSGELDEEILLIAAGGDIRFVNSRHLSLASDRQSFSLSQLLSIDAPRLKAALDPQAIAIDMSPNGQHGAALFNSAAGVYLVTFETSADVSPRIHYLGEINTRPSASFVSDSQLAVLTPLGDVLIVHMDGLITGDQSELRNERAGLTGTTLSFADASGVRRLAQAQRQMVASPDLSEVVAVGADGAIRSWKVPDQQSDSGRSIQLNRMVSAATLGGRFDWVGIAPEGYSNELTTTPFLTKRVREGDECTLTEVGCLETVEAASDDSLSEFLRLLGMVTGACLELYWEEEVSVGEINALRTEFGLEEQPFFGFGYPHLACKSTKEELLADSTDILDDDLTAPKDPFEDVMAQIPNGLNEAAIDSLSEHIRSYPSPELFKRTTLYKDMVRISSQPKPQLSFDDASRLAALVQLRTWSFDNGILDVNSDTSWAENQTRISDQILASAEAEAEQKPLDPDTTYNETAPSEFRFMILYTQIVDEEDRVRANELNLNLESAKLVLPASSPDESPTSIEMFAPGVELQNISLRRDSIRYYGEETTSVANALADLLRRSANGCDPEVRDLSSTYKAVDPDIIELWLTKDSACLPDNSRSANDTLDVRYYRMSTDDPRVLESLESALSSGELSVRDAQISSVPINMIACHPALSDAAFSKFKTIAIQLIDDGVELRRIAPFRQPNSKATNRVEILHSIPAQDGPIITREQVRALDSCVELPTTAK